MKKVLSMILALVMVFALSATAFADSTWNGTDYEGDNTTNVTASYTAGTSSVVNVCKVVITWEVTNGSKVLGNVQYTWNADEHRYEAGEATGVVNTDPSVKVTFTNHSDVVLYANITYADTNNTVESSAAAINGVELATGVTVTDDNYAGATYVQPDAVEQTMNITIADWTAITQTDEVIGTVTVELTKTAPAAG